MKTPLLLFLLLFSCSNNSTQKTEPIPDLILDGFWLLSSCQQTDINDSKTINCPAVEALFEPRALGTHFLIKKDSISFFYYPYTYSGTFKYEVKGDSLFVKNDASPNKFSVQKNEEGVLILNFEEEFTTGCFLSSEAKYERFTPDYKTINQLFQDSISIEPLMGNWWYLRKEIGYDDGTEPTILKFPKGMPDSIFLSKEIIKKDGHQPFIELKLKNRTVKMFIQNPSEYSYTLVPELEKDKILFSYLIDYKFDNRVDTIYYEVIYGK